MADNLKGAVTISGKDVKIERAILVPPKTLDKLVEENRQKIMEVKNIFPFDLFPDKIIISKTKVDLVYGLFFFSDHIISMLIKDLKNAKVTTGILFASMSFELQGYEVNPEKIKFLPIAKAMQARRIIEGLIASEAKGIDLSSFEPEELMDKLEEIGRARTE
ncbi:hypothetical protein KW795_02815 [Candidatus Microgenomates bacterium]|nr:hypothetical protein [Candidatus Microgenomates bacterium]